MTFKRKDDIIGRMEADTNTHLKTKDCSENFNQQGYHPIIPSEREKYRIFEIQKTRCHNKIEFHAKNVILQSIVSFLCIAGGIYAGQKRSILVPLVLAPSAAASLSKLTTHEIKRRRYKDILRSLENT